MTCATCGAAVTQTGNEGGVTEGWFKEEYTCVNDHTGWVEGKAEAPAQEWNRYGGVFNGL